MRLKRSGVAASPFWPPCSSACSCCPVPPSPCLSRSVGESKSRVPSSVAREIGMPHPCLPLGPNPATTNAPCLDFCLRGPDACPAGRASESGEHSRASLTKESRCVLRIPSRSRPRRRRPNGLDAVATDGRPRRQRRPADRLLPLPRLCRRHARPQEDAEGLGPHGPLDRVRHGPGRRPAPTLARRRFVYPLSRPSPPSDRACSPCGGLLSAASHPATRLSSLYGCIRRRNDTLPTLPPLCTSPFASVRPINARDWRHAGGSQSHKLRDVAALPIRRTAITACTRIHDPGHVPKTGSQPPIRPPCFRRRRPTTTPYHHHTNHTSSPTLNATASYAAANSPSVPSRHVRHSSYECGASAPPLLASAKPPATPMLPHEASSTITAPSQAIQHRCNNHLAVVRDG